VVKDGTGTGTTMSRYGYISSGGGKKYTSPLNQLFVGCRVFAYIPGTGYVGVVL